MASTHPIETLYDRLIDTFENTSEISNARLIAYTGSQLSRYIRIESGEFSTPFSDHDTKEIVLNKRFLCLVWCITYIILEITQNKSTTAKKITETYTELDGQDAEVQQLNYLFDWAFSLKKNESSDIWPVGLPMPTMQTYGVRAANVIFIDAISYIMFHEVAHIVNGHWYSYKEIASKLRTGELLNENEKSLCIQMEQEADTFAYDCLVSSHSDEDIIYHKQLGIVMACLASMFALKPNTKLSSFTHPSVHVRVFSSCQRTQLNEGDNFQLCRVMNVGLSMFCKLQGIGYEDKGFNSFNELLDYFFELLEISANEVLQY